jgi:hypothetical protein
VMVAAVHSLYADRYRPRSQRSQVAAA